MTESYVHEKQQFTHDSQNVLGHVSCPQCASPSTDGCVSLCARAVAIFFVIYPLPHVYDIQNMAPVTNLAQRRNFLAYACAWRESLIRTYFMSCHSNHSCSHTCTLLSVSRGVAVINTAEDGARNKTNHVCL